MTLRDSVTHYIDHLQERPWIEALVAEHGLDEVLGACVEVLQARDPAEAHHVTTLLRDLGIGGLVDEKLVDQVRELLPARVLPALRPLLSAPVLQLRMTAIYTLGKLTFREEAEPLREVFPSYVERDPLCLARLLGELQWLGEDVSSRLEQTIAHPSYLIRWAALGHLDCCVPAEDERETRSRWLRTLSSDPEPRVAAEARYQLADLEAKNAAEPSLTFSMVEIQFLNAMKEADYSLEELDRFVRSL